MYNHWFFLALAFAPAVNSLVELICFYLKQVLSNAPIHTCINNNKKPPSGGSKRLGSAGGE